MKRDESNTSQAQDGETGVKKLTLQNGSEPGEHDGAAAPVLLTSRSAARLGFLSSDFIMSRLGVYEPMATKELILRDEGLVGIQDECAQSLMALEILSLSHNKLTTLQGFQHWSNLIELNLNFNQISSLHNLQCFGLEKLFLSNNRITDITPLKAFTKLNTLSVYGNLITDLESSLSTCRALTKLRSLDLGGNPCSQEIDGYKFQVVRYLPRLKILDGDQVTQLDKDLADERVTQGRPPTADQRPSTATSMGSRPLTAKPWEAGAPPLTPSKPFDPFTSKLMPKGNVRLFRDDFLNNNPILLEYLAQESHDPETLTIRHDGDDAEDDASDETTTLSRSSSFVEKMRGANPSPDDTSAYDHDAIETESSTRPITPATSRPSTAASGYGMPVLTSNLGIDPSDPKTTIRKLLKHIEVLEESLAGYKSHQVEASEQALMEENRRLQIENNNIPILQEQVSALKKQLSLVNGACPPIPTSLTASQGPEAKKMKDLEQSNEQLRREVTRLRQMLKSHEVAASEATTSASSGTGDTSAERSGTDTSATVKTKRLSDSRLLEESASVDVELTELILQNEVSLEMIRNDIKNTKKEWEEQFQIATARERERQRVRPQTSLGLLHSGLGVDSTTPRLDKALDLLPLSSASVGKAKPSKGPELRGRQLHTSAGFRHGTGPEERLLHQASHTSKIESSSGRSATNILTL